MVRISQSLWRAPFYNTVPSDSPPRGLSIGTRQAAAAVLRGPGADRPGPGPGPAGRSGARERSGAGLGAAAERGARRPRGWLRGCAASAVALLSGRGARFTSPAEKKSGAFPRGSERAADALAVALFLGALRASPRLPAQAAAASAGAARGRGSLLSALRGAPRSASPRSLGTKGHRLRPVRLPAAAELEIRKQRALFVTRLTAKFIKA